MQSEFKLKINSVLEALVFQLSDEDDTALDNSIKKDGQWIGFPLTAAPDGDICDGMNRYKKFLKYKVEAKYVINKSLDTLEKKKFFVIQNVLARRHLNNWQKGLLGLELMKLEHHGQGKKAVEIAKEIPGLHSRTFEKIIKIDKEANENIRKKLNTGIMSVNTAYNLVTKKDRNLPKVPLPTEKHDVFYVDIPIRWDDEGVRGSADNHYPTMSKEELMLEKIPAAKDAIMFFWIPSAFKLDGTGDIEKAESTAAQILHAWGFNYCPAEFIWEKNRIGSGSWNRNMHETLIIAVKGKMPTPLKLYPSIIKADRKKHSEKPEVVYDMIEKMYPKRKYCELYSRKSRLGWTSHGNQVKDVIRITGTNETSKSVNVKGGTGAAPDFDIKLMSKQMPALPLKANIPKMDLEEKPKKKNAADRLRDLRKK